MIGRWLRLARGQVRVRVTGASLPRFLNVCALNNLILRRMKRTDWNEMYCVLSVEDFKKLRRYMGRTGCRVHIVDRRGAPFQVERFRPRYALWGGVLLLCALCWLMTSRVWSIETRLSPTLPRAEILSQLQSLGVQIGVPRRSINAKQVRWRMLQLQPDITFFALNVQGNRLVVEARSVVDRPEMLDEDAAVKVVAARDGVIENMNVQEGAPLVAVGDAVQAGDTLVSGLVPPTNETGRYHLSHARAEVQAYTSYHTTAKRALAVEQKAYTGKVKKQYALVFGKRRLNLYFGSGISGGTCDKIVETKTAWLSDSVVFPVSLVVQTYTYYERKPVTQAAQDVGADMLSRALNAIAAGMDGAVTGHDYTVAEQDGAAVLQLSAQGLEQIGVEALDDSEIPETPPAAQQGQ